MKAGIVVPYSWSFWGGVQEHADHQARALRDLGVEAKILMGHDPPGRLTKLLHPKEGRHTRPPDYVIPVGRSVIVPANASLPNIILSPPAMLRMRRIFAEERFDVGIVFCAKAIDVEPRHLAARLLLAKIYDKGLGNLEAAVAAYKKVIALAGYDGTNSQCIAAREALDALVQKA